MWVTNFKKKNLGWHEMGLNSPKAGEIIIQYSYALVWIFLSFEDLLCTMFVILKVCCFDTHKLILQEVFVLFLIIHYK